MAKTTLPTSAKIARRLGLKSFFTGKPCRNGHIGPRYTSTGVCCACNAKNTRVWRLANPEKERKRERVLPTD